MCDACPTSTDPDDDGITWRDMDAGTAELFRSDAAKPRRDVPRLDEVAAGFGSHQPWNCPRGRGHCAECGVQRARERVIEETEREQQYDADEAERWAS